MYRPPAFFRTFIPNFILPEIGDVGSVEAFRFLMQLCSYNHKKEHKRLHYAVYYTAMSLSEIPGVLQSNIKRTFENLKEQFEKSVLWRRLIDLKSLKCESDSYQLKFTVRLQQEFKDKLVAMFSPKGGGFTRCDDELLLPQLADEISEEERQAGRTHKKKNKGICFKSKYEFITYSLIRQWQFASTAEKTITYDYNELRRLFGCLSANENKYNNRPDLFIMRVLKPVCKKFSEEESCIWTQFSFRTIRKRRNSGENDCLKIAITFKTDIAKRKEYDDLHPFDWEAELLFLWNNKKLVEQVRFNVLKQVEFTDGLIWDDFFVKATLKIAHQKEYEGRTGHVDEKGKKAEEVKNLGAYVKKGLFEALWKKPIEQMRLEEVKKEMTRVFEKGNVLEEIQNNINKNQEAKEKEKKAAQVEVQKPITPVEPTPIQEPQEPWSDPDVEKYRREYEALLQYSPRYFSNHTFEDYLAGRKLKLEGDRVMRL